jgi:DNA-binding NarL/FixJ family response regulator
MRILLADDQARVRHALRVLLEQGGNRIAEAADAQELLTRSAELQPDLVLLDWTLLGVAPAGLIAELHAACPAMAVVVLSSWSGAREAALAAGADDFVSKADPPEGLLAAVRVAGEARNQQGGRR